MAPGRRIPEATVSRLPVYLRVLGDAGAEGEGTISSEHLGARAGVNAAQVRKDLSHLGSYGTRGVGYEVAFLIHQINRQLGLGADRNVAIVGVGNLGHALAGYGGFPARGFRVMAAFDTDPAKVGTRLGDLTVRDMAAMAETVSAWRITMAVVTTPSHAAQGVTDALIAAGVTSILNFAPTRLSVGAGVALRQVDLGVELQILSFYENQAVRGEPVRAVDLMAGDSRGGRRKVSVDAGR